MDNPDVPIGQTNDLATLGNLDEKILLGELKYRYNHDKIYTYVGDILVAINPFRDLGIYDQKHAEMYKNKIRVDNPPHIFAVSDAAYQSMLTGSAVSGKKNQCVVISGESGAGKTESTKFIIKQVIELCKGKSQLEQQILQVNPLLEAFGNAQTTMNDNSSRFGKYIQLKFKDGKVMGAKISEYLLEKSRVVFQNKGEENFHIFYYMLAGLTPEQQKKYKMQAADKYNYLTNGPSSAKTKETKMKDMLAELSNAMDLVGFLDEEQDEMYSVLAATLMMGQIQLDANEDDAAFIKGSDQAVSAVAELIGINDEELKQVLTFNLSSARGDVFQRNYTKHQALDARDAMTKTLYGRLFSWIVNKVNQLLAPEISLHVSDTTEIGILDIFGFEQFQTNSFEQMCINLANEQLQYFFNQHIFLLEQEEYKNEGIDWTYVPFVNNQSLLDLFLAKPIGVLGLLDEECLFPKATDHTFVEKLNQNFARNHHFIKAKNATSNNFSIDHYAGRVDKMESTTKEPRFALLTDDELTEFLDSSASENTKKSVRYAMKILDSYCKVRNTTVSALELMNHTDLDNFLRRFYTEVRQLDGEKYSKKSMQSIRYGLQKHFKDRENNPVDIVNDHAFERSNRCFKAMLVHLKKIGKGYSEHKNPITPEDMDKINASPVTDLSTPAGLQNKVYIDTMIYFCNRGRENVRDMKKTDFKINTDSNGLRYITKRDQLTKNNRENSSDKSQAGVMYEVPGNPRCPVNSLLLYMQKLHPICEYFWQRPKDNTCTSSDTTWYCKSPLGKNTLSNKLKEISTAARCGKIYTNHCFRATSVTILDNAGFESRDIMTVSGHHSETSIKNYSRTSESRKRDMSAVISAAVNSKLSAAAAAPSSSHTEPAGEQGQFAAGPSSSHTEPAGPSSSHSEPAGPSSSHAEPAGLTPDQTRQQGQSSPLLTESQESLILRDVVNSPVHLGNITSSPVATNVNINADATNNRTFNFHGCIVNFYR